MDGVGVGSLIRVGVLGVGGGQFCFGAATSHTSGKNVVLLA